MQWRGFSCLFTLGRVSQGDDSLKGHDLIPLHNDLRELTRWINQTDTRLATLISNEPIASDPTGNPTNTLGKHARTHATTSSENTFAQLGGTDPIDVYPFTWRRTHTWTPSTDVVANVITGSDTFTSDLWRLTADDLTTVKAEWTNDFHLGIRDTDPTALLSMQSGATTAAQVLALGPYLWWSGANIDGADNANLVNNDMFPISTGAHGRREWYDSGPSSFEIVADTVGSEPAIWTQTGGTGGPSTLPNGKPTCGTHAYTPTSVGTPYANPKFGGMYGGGSEGQHDFNNFTIVMVVAKEMTAAKALLGSAANNVNLGDTTPASWQIPATISESPLTHASLEFNGNASTGPRAIYYWDVAYPDSGTWHRLTVRRNAGTIQMWIMDTEQVTSVAFPPENDYASDPWRLMFLLKRISNNGDGSNGNAGYVADTIIFNSALSDTNLRTVWNYMDTRYGDGVNYVAPASSGGGSEDLTHWKSVSGAVKGVVTPDVFFGFGTDDPAQRVHILDTATQLRVGYDTSNYANFAVSSGGSLTISPTNDLTLTPAGGDTTITGTATVTTSLSAGAAGFTVNTTGNITKINSVTTSWPGSQGAADRYLRNDGAGTLTWAQVSLTLGVTGTLPTTNGGTGLASYTAGDTIYYASGTAFTKVAIGTAGQLWRSTGTAPAWSTATFPDTATTGDLLYGSASNVWSNRTIGSSGDILTVSGGVPVWGAPATVTAHTILSATHTDTLADTVVRGDVIVGNSTPKWARLAKGTTGTILRANATDLTYSTFTIADTYARGDLVRASAADTLGGLTIGSASTLLKSDGTDPSWGTVNLLSAFHGDTTTGTVARGDLVTGQGASPTWTRLAKGTANQAFRMDSSAVDCGWGTLAVGGGGTGLSSLTTGSIIYAGSSSTFTQQLGTNGTVLSFASGVPAYTAVGSTGQILRSGGSGVATWSTATFPSTAGTSGNILISDGTNWASTTVGTDATLTSAGVLTIANNAVTYTKFQDSSVGFTVLGKSTTGSGDYGEIVAGTDTILGRVGSGNLAFSALSAFGGASGTGTMNTLPKWTSTSGALGDSHVTDDGTTITSTFVHAFNPGTTPVTAIIAGPDAPVSGQRNSHNVVLRCWDADSVGLRDLRLFSSITSAPLASLEVSIDDGGGGWGSTFMKMDEDGTLHLLGGAGTVKASNFNAGGNKFNCYGTGSGAAGTDANYAGGFENVAAAGYMWGWFDSGGGLVAKVLNDGTMQKKVSGTLREFITTTETFTLTNKTIRSTTNDVMANAIYDGVAATGVTTTGGTGAGTGKVLRCTSTTAAGFFDDSSVAIYGDGVDGAVTLNGSTDYSSVGFSAPVSSAYTLDRDVYCTSLTINSGITLYTAGFRIFCNTLLTNNGTIQAGTSTTITAGGNGGDGVTTTPGSAGSAGTAAVAGSVGAAGVGGAGTAGTVQPNPSTQGGTGGSITGEGGASGAGGQGGDGNGTGSPGAGGPVGTQKVFKFRIFGQIALIRGVTLLQGGCGGGGGSGGTGDNAGNAGGGGGGGGAGGGIVAIWAKQITSGTGGNVFAKGQNGGNGGNGANANCGKGGGGGGGGGGWIYVASDTAYPPTSITFSARHGNKGVKGATTGTGGNDGADGSDGVLYYYDRPQTIATVVTSF